MKVLRKILSFIADPIRKVNYTIDNDRLTKFFSRHAWIIFIFAIIITGVIFFFAYFSGKIWG